MPEPVTLAEAKAYIRVTTTAEDAKITGMIPRARLWVEDHTGLALDQRTFTEYRSPDTNGVIRLARGPLVSVTSVTYNDSAGVSQSYTPRIFVPSPNIIAAADTAWPSPRLGEQLKITYTAGYGAGAVDALLIGAMLALIEGEYDSGRAYPDEAVKAAERCCAYLRTPVA